MFEPHEAVVGPAGLDQALGDDRPAGAGRLLLQVLVPASMPAVLPRAGPAAAGDAAPGPLPLPRRSGRSGPGPRPWHPGPRPGPPLPRSRTARVSSTARWWCGWNPAAAAARRPRGPTGCSASPTPTRPRRSGACRRHGRPGRAAAGRTDAGRGPGDRRRPRVGAGRAAGGLGRRLRRRRPVGPGDRVARVGRRLAGPRARPGRWPTALGRSTARPAGATTWCACCTATTCWPRWPSGPTWCWTCRTCCSDRCWPDAAGEGHGGRQHPSRSPFPA